MSDQTNLRLADRDGHGSGDPSSPSRVPGRPRDENVPVTEPTDPKLSRELSAVEILYLNQKGLASAVNKLWDENRRLWREVGRLRGWAENIEDDQAVVMDSLGIL